MHLFDSPPCPPTLLHHFQPTLLGVASVPLRSVLQSSDLSILDVDLDVKDKSQPSSSSKMGQESSTDGHSPSDTIIGDLKVSLKAKYAFGFWRRWNVSILYKYRCYIK